MYKVYCDEYMLYSETIPSLQIDSAKVELELNTTGLFEFTVYPTHPYYNMIHKLKSIITVYQDDFLLFRGRVLNDEVGFFNEKKVDCEGHLAFLLDTIQRPYVHEGYLKDCMAAIIAEHNAQVEASHQFTLGTVSGGEAYVYISSTEHQNTWDAINKEYLETYGGYMLTRTEGGVHYIDLVDGFTAQSTQSVEFAKNLLDMKRIRKGEEITTALIPLGAKLKDAQGNDTEERLTVKSVNDGLDYIQDKDAVSEYGWICKSNTWDEIDDASMLLSVAQAHLARLVGSDDTLELNAADLASIDESVDSFRLGTNIRVVSNPHGINQNFLVNQLSIDLLNPASDKLVLGGKIKPFTANLASVSVHDGKDGKDGKDAAILRIDSSRGTVFKNNQITTTLTVAIYYGDKRIINKSELTKEFGAGAYLEWHWQRMDETTFGLISASDSRIGNDGFSLTLTPADIDTKATFICNLIV